MGVLQLLGRMLGSPQIELNETERATVLAQSPYEIEQYSVQGMGNVIYLILDPRIKVECERRFPPCNCIKQLDGPHGARGLKMAEDWVIREALLAGES